MTDVQFMQEALAQARHAATLGEVPVGAVVVRDGQVLARAHNAPVGLHDPTAHAEIRALREAARLLGNYRLEDCTLYVTLEPCAMCSGAILHARLARVVYGAPEPRTGAAGSVLDVLHSGLNHHTQIEQGVLADDCAAVLQSFFAARRQAQQATREPLREDALRTPDTCWEGLDLPWSWSRYASDWPSLQGWRVHWFDNRVSDATGAAQHAATSPATLYLHDAQSWSLSHLAALRTDGPALALDWLGFGLSDKPKKEGAYSAALHAAVLEDLLSREPIGRIVAPASVAPILACLPARWQALPVQVVELPLLREAQARAPYPDRGHEAGRRAWRTMSAVA